MPIGSADAPFVMRTAAAVLARRRQDYMAGTKPTPWPEPEWLARELKRLHKDIPHTNASSFNKYARAAIQAAQLAAWLNSNPSRRAARDDRYGAEPLRSTEGDRYRYTVIVRYTAPGREAVEVAGEIWSATHLSVLDMEELARQRMGFDRSPSRSNRREIARVPENATVNVRVMSATVTP